MTRRRPAAWCAAALALSACTSPSGPSDSPLPHAAFRVTECTSPLGPLRTLHAPAGEPRTVQVNACPSPPGPLFLVPLIHVATLELTGLTRAERLVIRDAAAWNALWARMRTGPAVAPAPPPLDFSREMVVVAALGEQRTNRWRIAVEAARLSSHGLGVWVSTRPPCGAPPAAVLTQPVALVSLPRYDVEVRFFEVYDHWLCP